MRTDKLTSFNQFKEKISEGARGALAETNPEYIRTLHGQLKEAGGDLDRATRATNALISTDFPHWPDLLTAILDFEAVLDKMTRSLGFMRFSPVQSAMQKGAWFDYHLDYWCFLMDALLERVDRLVALTFRRLVRPKDKDWQAKQAHVRDDVNRMKQEIAKIRDPLAHGLGGGITGIQEERLWEPYLAMGHFDVDLVGEFYERIEEFQDRWVDRVEQTTVLALGGIEAIFGKLSEHVE